MQNNICDNKILKTVRGSIKKAIFYLEANIPYGYSSLLITPLIVSIDKIKKITGE